LYYIKKHHKDLQDLLKKYVKITIKSNKKKLNKNPTLSEWRLKKNDDK